MAESEGNAPLAEIRVLEVANFLAVPSAAALLADMGASVVKVEPPAGDPFRSFRMESMGHSGDFPINYAFELDNRGKRSISLDLDRDGARQAVLRLAESCDVFLTNLVPTRRERYGLTYGDVSARNPRVVYLGFSGYGAAGPDRDRLGFDVAAFWARSGIMGLVGEPDNPPALQRVGMGDHTTSSLLVAGVLAALFQRERSGVGQEVEASLLNTGLWVLGADLQVALVTRQAPRRAPRTAAPNPIWNSYQARDGRWILLVMPIPDPYWPGFCAAIGRPELADDPRYRDLPARMAHCEELVALLDEAFATATREEWGQRLDAHGLIWAPVQDLEEVIQDPQVRANAYFTTIEHPTVGPYETVDTPLKFGRGDVRARGPAPELGQHTEEVLLEAGYTREEIATLREQGVMG